jgi:hypothetical protein
MERKSLDQLFELTAEQRREAEAIDQETRKLQARHRVNLERRKQLLEQVVETALHDKGPQVTMLSELLGIFRKVRMRS